MIRWISVDGRKLCYRIKGSGPSLVLLHGFLMSSATWGLFLDELSSSYKVIAPDFPGHGLSEFNPPHNSMEGMADVVAKILDAENIEHCALLGHSMGGYAGLAFLERYPEKISKFILLNSHPFADTPEKIIIRRRTIQLLNSDKKDFFLDLAFKELFPSCNPEAANSVLKSTLEIARRQTSESISSTIMGMQSRPDRSTLLKNHRIQIKWILSEEDNQFDAKVFTREAEKHNLVLPEIVQGEHMSFFQNPELIARIVKDFI